MAKRHARSGPTHRAEEKRLFGKKVPVFPLDLLVWAKATSDRYEDLRDVQAMLQRGLFDPLHVHVLIDSVDPQAAREFAALIREMQTPRLPRVRRPGKRLPPKKKV